MHVTTYVCGSCAVAGIHDLGIHKNAVDAMKMFCRLELGNKDRFAVSGSFKFKVLHNYYIFCAGPEVPLGEPGSSHHSKAWVKYGTEFAAFIADNDLGQVVTLGPKPNLKYHKSTTAQVWAWSPKQKSLENWWRKNGGVPKPPKALSIKKDPNLDPALKEGE